MPGRKTNSVPHSTGSAAAGSFDNWLIEAATDGNRNEAMMALAAGADVHAENNAALRRAAAFGHAGVVGVLLAAGADVHDCEEGALCSAAYNGHDHVVALLLSSGANPQARHSDALGNAADGGHFHVVERLIAAGSNLHANHEAALRRAARAGRVDVVHYLLSAGANPVVAWSATGFNDLDATATTIDACADVITPKHRVVLATRSQRFIRLRALGGALRQACSLQR